MFHLKILIIILSVLRRKYEKTIVIKRNYDIRISNDFC